MSEKICILTDSLGFGGAEKMAANMSLSLTKRGYQVCIVSMLDNIKYEYAGTLFNFGKVKENNHRLKAFLDFKSFFKNNDFDVIIDHRVRSHFFKELLFSKFIFAKKRIIYCIHSFNLSLYFSHTTNSFLAKLPHVRDKQFVVISKEAQLHLKQGLNIDSKIINNYVLPELPDEVFDKPPYAYIIAVGRLVKMKQFDVLIKSYKNTQLLDKNIKLLIFGEGEEKENLQSQINSLGLHSFVLLKGFNQNVSSYIKQAKALVLSSKFEGFPMVLIEALTLKTPMIAFNCKSGPAEIIKHEINGLLVENQNQEALSKAMNTLVLNDEFYYQIKTNIEKLSNPFSEEIIIEQWINLVENSN